MSQNYLVLARKYRPSSFAHLKGQEFLVTTIVNALKLGRVAHTFLLTGIRGIGKTTTARIMAKTFNCTNLITEANLISPCGTCANCQAAAMENHPDIIELDAASRTGVNDIREIIESANYLPLLGKYKIYIIDEVHMLSTSAFNALLKTLEEPPAHVKFIFATTETRKIPITILSRCQRFDLRRLTQDELVNHLKDILAQEKIEAELDALQLIAASAEGSVRDSLSLLDLAIANGDNSITTLQVRNLLGFSDKTEIITLFEFMVSGNASASLTSIKQFYYTGKDLLNIFQQILELTHNLSKIKLDVKNNIHEYSEMELKQLSTLASKLTIPTLTIIWQMLLKGMQEIQANGNQLMAAEMLAIRICHLSNIPSISSLISEIDNKPVLNKTPQTPKAMSINSFEDMVELFRQKREMLFFQYLVDDVNLVEFSPPLVRIRQGKAIPYNFANKLTALLQEWTGEKWNISLTSDDGEPTLTAQADLVKAHQIDEFSKNDMVQEVLKNFKSAQIQEIIKN